MNEQEQISQLSALFDGELPPEQAGMVIRRALRDPATRATWGRYALIGACVRGDPIGSALPQSDVAARVRARLAAEAEHSNGAAIAGAVAASNAARRRSLLGRGALGGAIAAGVAAVSLVMVRMLGPAALPTGAQLAAAPAPRNETLVVAAEPAQRASVPAAVREASLPSYTTPVDDSPARRNAPLVSYVVAHNQVAASAVGFAPLSSVKSGSYDLTQDAVEMTPAEVGCASLMIAERLSIPVRAAAACMLAMLAQVSLASGSPDARAWIARMNEALARRNYDGVFVQQVGNRRDTLRIIHRVRDGRMTERLIFTTVPAASTFAMDRRPCGTCPRSMRSSSRSAAASAATSRRCTVVSADTEKYYQLRSAEHPVRVRGFTARLITVEPRDELRYGYRYWIDEKTSMPVRTQLVSPTGEVLGEISFISMSLPDMVDDELLKPDVDTTGFRWLRRDTPAPANSVKITFVPRENLMPPGFRVKTFGGPALGGHGAPQPVHRVRRRCLGICVHRKNRCRSTGRDESFRGPGADGNHGSLHGQRGGTPHHRGGRRPGNDGQGHRRRCAAGVA